MTEDEVLAVVEKEANWAYHGPVKTGFVGACSTCGERHPVIAHVIDMSTECETCFIKRRYTELMAPSKCPLDVEDFARI